LLVRFQSKGTYLQFPYSIRKILLLEYRGDYVIFSLYSVSNNKEKIRAFEIFLLLSPFLEDVRLEANILGLVRSFSHFCDPAYDDVEIPHRKRRYRNRKNKEFFTIET